MVLDGFFYELLLCVLLGRCSLLSWVWLSDRAAPGLTPPCPPSYKGRFFENVT